MRPFLPSSSAPEPSQGPAAEPTSRSVERRWAVVGALLGGLVLVLFAGLLALVWLGRTGGLPTAGTSAGPVASQAPEAGSFLFPDPQPAPPLALVDQDANPFDLGSLRGAPALVFFGYTHCPDVCPATVGVLNRVLGELGEGPRAVFVSVDPERDTPAALKDYLEFLPDGYIALTGTPAEVRSAADGYSVNYARIDTGSASGYAMAHTAGVFLIDGNGLLRGRFPFGTEAAPIAATVREVEATSAGTAASPTTGTGSTPPAGAAPTPAASGSPSNAGPSPTTGAATLRPVVLTTSIWSGGSSPVLMSLTDEMGSAVGGSTTAATLQLTDETGSAVGVPVTAQMIRPPGEQHEVLLARLDIPTAGHWRVEVAVTDAGRSLRGWTDINVLDPGETAALGKAAPDARTPTAADAGGDLTAVTTDPQPDPRLSETSTADARAARRPYVLIVDSYRFRVSPACGLAIGMARFLADRWPGVAFIHLEPYHYSIVSDTPVLEGDISNPKLTEVVRSWGLGYGQWGPASVPWVFVVDGNGVVQAKYTGVLGSDDIDVILADIVD
jgi:protein SCO1/2